MNANIKKTVMKIIKKIVFGYRGSSEGYIRHLRRLGAEIGDDVVIHYPIKTSIDSTAAYLLSIGDHVNITGPATILTHDYSWSVIKRKYGDICGNQKKTVIGNNVFIGWGATLLGGVVIGNDVIIGANSVVSGNVESGTVYAGNPAKKIMTLEEYYEKRKAKQLEEAVGLVKCYVDRYGCRPPKDELREYFFLFCNDEHDLSDEYLFQMRLMSNYEQSLNSMKNTGNDGQAFDNYEDFLEYCYMDA